MFNSNCKKFEEELTKLINSSGLTVAEAYYIVENAALNLKILYYNLAFQESNNNVTDNSFDIPVMDNIEAVEQQK